MEKKLVCFSSDRMMISVRRIEQSLATERTPSMPRIMKHACIQVEEYCGCLSVESVKVSPLFTKIRDKPSTEATYIVSNPPSVTYIGMEARKPPAPVIRWLDSRYLPTVYSTVVPSYVISSPPPHHEAF